jgi:hypothetical protein
MQRLDLLLPVWMLVVYVCMYGRGYAEAVP